MASVTGSQVQPNPSNQVNSKQSASYANTVKSDMFPTKSQAIVIDSVDGAPIKEYIQSIGNLIGPANIKFVSRISMSRVCMYLSSESIVNKLTGEPTNIKIGNNDLLIRPLETKYKRIIISNVCPIIPHFVLENKLKEIGVRIGSKINFLKAGISDAGYSHILSFRRQIYIHPEDLKIIPESLKIEYDGTTYWVYLSSDTMICFICKTKGHPAKHCPSNKVNNDMLDSCSQENDVVDICDDIETEHEPSSRLDVQENRPILSDYPPLPDKSKVSDEFITVKGPKRPLSVTTTSSENTILGDTGNISSDDSSDGRDISLKKTSRKHKKAKTNSDLMDSQLSPIKPILTGKDNPYILDYLQLKCLLDSFQNSPNIIPVTLEYTSNTQEIIRLLKDTYPLLNDRSIKIKFTKLHKILQQYVENIQCHQASPVGLSDIPQFHSTD